MNIDSMLANWKTTSAGATLFTSGAVDLAFGIKHGTADATAWKTDIGLMVAGVGLILAGDASKSKADAAAVDAKVDQAVKAVAAGDTSILPKATPVEPPKTP